MPLGSFPPCAVVSKVANNLSSGFKLESFESAFANVVFPRKKVLHYLAIN